MMSGGSCSPFDVRPCDTTSEWRHFLATLLQTMSQSLAQPEQNSAQMKNNVTVE